jgi:dTDP-4-dehydrorhamnose 3,5-epimerase
MKITTTPLEGFFLIEPPCFQDERGFFLETYQESRYRKAGILDAFVQDNQSRSAKGVLRGIHFQIKRPQAQIVTVMRGRVFDVGVDLRPASPTFGRWHGVELSDAGPRQIYMAPGFAHGFCVLSDWADLHYKVSRNYDAHDEGGLLWNDPDVNIRWPLVAPSVGPRDAAYPRLKDLSPEQLPHEPAVEAGNHD